VAKTKIKTYTTEGFRQSYMQPEKKLDAMLKPDFGKFFVVKVQDLIRLIKLPVPPSRSTTHTVIYLTEGEAIMSIGSETYTIYKDECLFVPAGQVMSFKSLDINKGYLINFHNDFVIGKFGKHTLLKDFEFLQVWGNPRIVLGKTVSAYAHHFFKRLLLEYSESGLKNLDIIQSNFIALLCEINGVYKPVSSNSSSNSVHISNKFKDLLFANLKTKHLVADYAAMLNITPNHLNKSVKTVTGKSPIKWIDEAIVLEAKVLLYQSNFTIAEVAAEVGLMDASYFSRLFKKYEGMTPQQFRGMIEKS
jgi:AraC family transcriptional activator of pobA